MNQEHKKDSHVLHNNIERIKSLHHELILRLALFTHVRKHGSDGELLAELHKVEDEISKARSLAQDTPEGSDAEEECLMHLRQLEDLRFQLLSEVNGTCVSQYGMHK